MKKNLSRVVGIVVAIAVSLGTLSTVSAQIPRFPEKSCSVTIQSGWNLLSLAKLACIVIKIDAIGGSNSLSAISSFPAYLDFYIYSGEEYVHSRVNRGSTDLSIASSMLKYANIRAKEISNGKFSDIEIFIEDAEKVVGSNNISKIDEYAKQTLQEVFKSIWVYNPGNSFTVSHHSQQPEVSAIISAVSVGFGNGSNAEFSESLGFLRENLIDELERGSRNDPEYIGLLRYTKSLFTGKVALNKGWNFLSYSRVLGVNIGQNGTCNITKAYIFDNNTKNWVTVPNANQSMYGNGMIVYNANGACYINSQSEFVKKLTNLMRGGSENMPPVLPN